MPWVFKNINAKQRGTSLCLKSHHCWYWHWSSKFYSIIDILQEVNPMRFIRTTKSFNLKGRGLRATKMSVPRTVKGSSPWTCSGILRKAIVSSTSRWWGGGVMNYRITSVYAWEVLGPFCTSWKLFMCTSPVIMGLWLADADSVTAKEGMNHHCSI